MKEVFLIDKNNNIEFACFRIGLDNQEFADDKEFRLVWCGKSEFGGYTHGSLAYGFNSVEFVGEKELHVCRLEEHFKRHYVFERIRDTNRFIYQFETLENLGKSESIDSARQGT